MVEIRWRLLQKSRHEESVQVATGVAVRKNQHNYVHSNSQTHTSRFNSQMIKLRPPQAFFSSAEQFPLAFLTLICTYVHRSSAFEPGKKWGNHISTFGP